MPFIPCKALAKSCSTARFIASTSHLKSNRGNKQLPATLASSPKENSINFPLPLARYQARGNERKTKALSTWWGRRGVFYPVVHTSWTSPPLSPLHEYICFPRFGRLFHVFNGGRTVPKRNLLASESILEKLAARLERVKWDKKHRGRSSCKSCSGDRAC